MNGQRQLKTENGKQGTVNSGDKAFMNWAFLLVLSFLFTVHCSALSFGKGPGTTTGELLKIPVGARAIGMGEAYTAAANDSSAIFWNPAGMSLAEQKEANFMHSALIEGVHYEHLGFVSPGEAYSFGASMSYLGYGDIAGYDNIDGSPTGDVSAYSYIFSGAVSRQIGSRLSLGLTGSMIRQKLADASAGTFAANLGALYTLPWNVWKTTYRTAFAVQNLGQGLKFVSERSPLPRKVRFGLAAEKVHEWPLNVSFDVVMPNDNDTYIGIGSEYWFRQILALRLGYAGSNDEGQGLRLGVGLKLRSILFDYAYGSFGDFGATHRIGVSMRWGNRMKQMNDAQRSLLKEARRLMKDGQETAAIQIIEEILVQDPDNTKALKMMVQAHESGLQREIDRAKMATKPAATTSGSGDDMAMFEDDTLMDPVPGQEKFAKSPEAAAALDPLGLNDLPTALQVVDDKLPKASQSAMAPAVSVPVAPSPSVTEPAARGGVSGGTPAPEAGIVDSNVPSEEELLGGAPSAASSPTRASSPAAAASPVASDAGASDSGPMLNPADFQ